jgi:hypothetical protein
MPQGLDSFWIEELHTKRLYAQNYIECELNIIELLHMGMSAT